jgi:hypothetical protein
VPPVTPTPVPFAVPVPDPDATVTDAEEAHKCLSAFYAFAASHDPALTARHLTGDTSETLDMVGALRTWLRRYADALC